MSEHIERLHIERGTLIRLLAAMAPRCEEKGTAGVCPADIMPPWLARLTPSLDGNGSLEAWPGMVKRFAHLASRWHTLDAAAWRRVQFTWLAAVVREAASHTQSESAQAVCGRVAALCDGVVATGEIDAAEFEAAKRASAAASPLWTASASARAASWAAAAPWAAAAAAEEAASWAAAAAAEAASWAARASEAAQASWASWDRLTVALFDTIEKELMG